MAAVAPPPQQQQAPEGQGGAGDVGEALAEPPQGASVAQGILDPGQGVQAEQRTGREDAAEQGEGQPITTSWVQPAHNQTAEQERSDGRAWRAACRTRRSPRSRRSSP